MATSSPVKDPLDYSKYSLILTGVTASQHLHRHASLLFWLHPNTANGQSKSSGGTHNSEPLGAVLSSSSAFMDGNVSVVLVHFEDTDRKIIIAARTVQLL